MKTCRRRIRTTIACLNQHPRAASAPGSPTSKIRYGRLFTASLWVLTLAACSAGGLPPTGPSAVGTRLLSVAHPSTFRALMAEGPRTLPVQAWYPTSGVAGGDDVEDAPLSRPEAPLVVIIHGTGGERQAHRSLARNLASRGFLVIAADHIGLAREGMGRDIPAADPDVAKGLAEAMEGNDVLKAAAHPIYDKLRATLATDVRRMVELVPSLLPSVPRVTRYAVVGHSFGGMVGLDVCRADKRCSALVNLDGPPLGDHNGKAADGRVHLTPRPFGRPLLVVATGAYRGEVAGAEEAWQALEHLSRANKGPSLHMTIPGAGHLDVTELPLVLPPWLARRLFGGDAAISTLDPVRTVGATNAVATAFLERWHAGRTDVNPLLRAKPYPELKLLHAHGQ